MIDQNVPTSAGGLAEISFTVPREDLRDAARRSQPLAGEVFEELIAREEMGKVSIVGAGMRSHPGVAAKVFSVLADEGINIEMISTSPIKISCVIARDRVESRGARAARRVRALRAGHRGRGGAIRGAGSALTSVSRRLRP